MNINIWLKHNFTYAFLLKILHLYYYYYYHIISVSDILSNIFWINKLLINNSADSTFYSLNLWLNKT